jgi:hypothetical protein
MAGIIHFQPFASVLLPEIFEEIFEEGKTEDFCGGRYRARTYDPLIKSQLLYQLS